MHLATGSLQIVLVERYFAYLRLNLRVTMQRRSISVKKKFPSKAAPVIAGPWAVPTCPVGVIPS